jgi:alpha-beta hydrolase superfamily lysophospholipase
MLLTDERTGIKYRRWEATSPKAVLLLVHGLGAHSDRWTFLAEFLLGKDISSYAIELKGFGEEKGLKGHINTFDIYYADILRLREIISSENPNKKIFLLGESLGALVSFMLADRKVGLFDGLICISPAFSNRMKFSFLDYIKIFFAMLFSSQKQFRMPFDTTMCTRDQHYRDIMDADEREHRLATARLLYNTFMAQMRIKILGSHVTDPVLFLVSGEDKLVSPRASENVFAKLKSNDKNFIFYPDMYHSLSVDSGREQVFEDILEWVRERV